MFAKPLLIPKTTSGTDVSQCIINTSTNTHFLASNVTCLMSRTDVLHCIFNTSTHTHFLSIERHILNILYRCIALHHHQHINRYSLLKHQMSHAYHLIFSSNGSQLRGVCHKHTHKDLSGIFSIKHFKMFHIC